MIVKKIIVIMFLRTYCIPRGGEIFYKFRVNLLY